MPALPLFGDDNEGTGSEKETIKTRNLNPEEEAHEVAVVFEAHAVEHPRAVVVHVENQLPCHVVVVGARRLVFLTGESIVSVCELVLGRNRPSKIEVTGR